jgi:hypothetical protein
LEALVAVGLLDSTAARAWRRRLATAVDAAGSPRRAVIDPRMRRKFAALLNAVAHDQREEFLTVVTAALELGVISDAKAADMGVGVDGPDVVEPAFRTGAGPHTEAALGDAPHTVMTDRAGAAAIELYPGGVVVRRRTELSADTYAQLADDHGTEYLMISAGGGVEVWVPEVPQGASVLWLGDTPVEVGGGQQGPSPPPAVVAVTRHLEDTYTVRWLTWLDHGSSALDGYEPVRASDTAKLRLLTSAEVLSRDDASGWHKRFERMGGKGFRRGEVGALRARARDHLSTLDDLDALSGATMSYEGTGLLSRAEAQRHLQPWFAREVGDDPPWRLPEFDGSARIGVTGGPQRRVGGLRITAVELFAGGLSVHWQRDPAASRAASRRSVRSLLFDGEHVKLAITDDLGNHYYAVTSTVTSYGALLDELALGVHRVVPVVAAGARRLRVTVGDDAISIQVPRRR